MLRYLQSKIANSFVGISLLCALQMLCGRAAGQVIASENFENSLSLFSVTTGSAAYFSGNTPASSARPTSSPYATLGTYSFGIANGTVAITSSNINTSSYSNGILSFDLASFSIGSATNGADGADSIWVEVSNDGGTT